MAIIPLVSFQVFSLDEDLQILLGHASSIFYDMYRNNVDQAVLFQSIGGLLDYKNQLFDILGIASKKDLIGLTEQYIILMKRVTSYGRW